MQATSNAPRFTLGALPYAHDALAPLISQETLEYHYGKHHRAYVDKLNELISGSQFEAAALPDIIRSATGAIFNNAAQIWNHDFYWHCLTPKRDGAPTGELAAAINTSFGSFDTFATQFKQTALSKFGSGWTWLVRDQAGALSIRNSNDADNPLLWDQTPLLVCDVWEHAYYIDCRNARAKYVESFWSLVNWEFVARNFRDARVWEPASA